MAAAGQMIDSQDWCIKVSLQKGGIVFGFDAAVEDAIIGKETDCTIDGFVGEVVDVYQK